MDHQFQLYLHRLGFRVRAVSNPEKLLALPADASPAIIIVDVAAELDRGAGIVEELISRLRHARVIPVCANGSIEFFRRCFRAGAFDVLDKSFGDQHLAGALQGTGTPWHAQAASLACVRQRQARFDSLTGREREVFRYLMDGFTNREIAQLLTLSPRTIEIHRAHLQEKLSVKNVAQMAADYSGLPDINSSYFCNSISKLDLYLMRR
ncbi:MAG TPA: LuxR C-terminal-related transcriptional regulator [Telluria sp.]|nr:LuxR C-terminal-related transcriptional regulator [Telluria sp.]